ncbi:MAG: ATP-binding protein [Dehalococcoidia bacterium]
MDALGELLAAQRLRTEQARERRLTRTLGWSAATGPEPTSRGMEPEVCPLCLGARFVRVTTDVDDPRFGQPVPCECVQREDARGRHERLLRYSRLGALSRMTFATLLRRGRSDDADAQRGYEQAVAVAERYAEEPEGWLVLTGVPGCGKTHLAAAIATRAIERGIPALFFGVADLLDQLRASYGEDAELPHERLLEQLRNAPLVILDDLDAFAETAWAREVPAAGVTPIPRGAAHGVHLRAAARGARCAPRLATERPFDVTGAGAAGGERAALLERGGDDARAAPRVLVRALRSGWAGPAREGARQSRGAYRLARQWADAPHGWLVLVGKNGAGKTHLAAAAAVHRLQQGERVCFVNVPDLLDELRSTFAPGSASRFDRVFQPLLDVPLLVLDDPGAQQTSPWAQEKLYQIINHRHLARSHTIVTTNVELGAMEPRIASRLSDLDVAVVYEITAPDYRLGGV